VWDPWITSSNNGVPFLRNDTVSDVYSDVKGFLLVFKLVD
jgi:hypothetical protein